MWTILPYYCWRSGEKRQTGLRWWKDNSSSNNHLLQPQSAEYHVWMHNTWTLKQIAFSRRPSPPVPVMQTKNNTLGLQFPQAKIKIRDWKNFTWVRWVSNTSRLPVLKPVLHFLCYGGKGKWHHRCVVKSAATVWYCHVNLNQNVWGLISTHC